MNGIRKIGNSFETDPGGRTNEAGDDTETTPVEKASKPSKSRPTQDEYDKSGATANPYPTYNDEGKINSSHTQEDGESETNPEDEE